MENQDEISPADRAKLSTLTPERTTQTLAKCSGVELRLPATFGQIRPAVKPLKSLEELAAITENEERWRLWSDFIGRRGSRYAECRLGNFDAETDLQKAAIARLQNYAENVKARIEAGTGIVLYGPKGTGKDHLASAIARAAISGNRSVEWRNGADFFGDVRDAMDSKTRESEVVGKLVYCDLLYLSDPLPPIGSLTDFQASMLFRVLDGRYSNRKPCLVTVNATGRDELEKRMGAQNADRIRDGALAIFCNWPTYRHAQSNDEGKA